MSQEEINEFMESFEKNTKIITRSKESCQEYLISLGVNNRDGSLTEHYKRS